MYIKTETSDSWFERKSKTGKKHRYKRTKTAYHLLCDHCGLEFIRHKGDMDPNRFAEKYSHFCEKCFGQSAIKGQASRRRNLDKMIGDRQVDSEGYATVYVGKSHPYSKDYGGRVREHILVMENNLHRPLNKDKGSRRTGNAEVVHHIDGDRQNNDIKNLVLMTVQEHNACHGAAGSLIFDLYRLGIVGYNRDTKKYFIEDRDV